MPMCLCGGNPWFLSQGLVLRAPCRHVMLTTDASLTGWGAVMSDHPACCLWSDHHLTWHINCLEMLAVFRALKHFLPDLRDHHVLGRADILSRQGLRPGEWMLQPEVVKQIWRVWARLRWICLRLVRIAQSPLVISDSYSSAGDGCYSTDLAEASSVRLYPIALLTGVLERESAPGLGPSIAKTPFWPC